MPALLKDFAMRLGSPLGRSGASHCRRAVALVSLLGYLVALAGYPVSVRPRKVSAERFPCEHHACGCQDAEQCWRNCCCFTPREKFAWAREHHVTPPTYAQLESDEVQLAGDHDESDAAAAEHRDHEHLASADADDHDHHARHAHAGCCNHCADGHCLAGGANSGEAKRFAARGCNTPAHGVDKSAPVDRGMRLVSSDAWRKCRGLPTLWVTSGAAVAPPPAVRWQYSWVVVEWLSTDGPDAYGGNLLPPVPPPRV